MLARAIIKKKKKKKKKKNELSHKNVQQWINELFIIGSSKMGNLWIVNRGTWSQIILSSEVPLYIYSTSCL